MEPHKLRTEYCWEVLLLVIKIIRVRNFVVMCWLMGPIGMHVGFSANILQIYTEISSVAPFTTMV